ncbi:MAG: DUF6462 family protein [Lachnospiraceae bacterium]|nr:DUF6462 family protein [Lachnospiraceae bacterium]
MLKKLKPSIRSYIHDDNIYKRYLRPAEASKIFGIDESNVIQFASAAGAIYQLPRILLICHQRLEEYMKHHYKVPGTNKLVHKKYVRIGEGSIIYSIGHHRFIEMARAAGAVYKINEGTGGTVLINLELFDDYLEQFRENAVPMKNPLWKESEN